MSLHSSEVSPSYGAYTWTVQGAIDAIVVQATNALGKSMNAKIQKIKLQACGYRNRERFRNAIMFHLGGLDFVSTNRINPHGFLKRQRRWVPQAARKCCEKASDPSN
jgi:hypothetical protein